MNFTSRHCLELQKYLLGARDVIGYMPEIGTTKGTTGKGTGWSNTNHVKKQNVLDKKVKTIQNGEENENVYYRKWNNLFMLRLLPQSAGRKLVVYVVGRQIQEAVPGRFPALWLP